MSKRLTAHFDDYQSYHRTVGNKVCHYAGIPMIMISTLGLLATIPIGPSSLFGSALFRIDVASLVWVAVTLRYFAWSWRLSVPFMFITLAFYFVGRSIPVPALWAIFVLGWIFQGIGHAVYEKKSPAFTKNFEHLLIGPLWIFARIARYI